MPRHADKQGADNGRARTGSAGNYRQHLKKPYDKGGFVIDCRKLLDSGGTLFVYPFHDDEQNTVKDKGAGNNGGRLQMRFDKVAE